MCNCIKCSLPDDAECDLCPPVDRGDVCPQHEDRWCDDCGRLEHIGGCRKPWDEPAYYEHKHSFFCDPGGGVAPGTRCSGLNCPVRWPVPVVIVDGA